jgi:GNAT superfamily N-acetyltransferase
MSGLPDGLRVAPLAPEDGPAILAVWSACEQHDDGRVEIVEADVVASFAGTRLELARDTVGVRAGDALVAFGIQYAVRHTFVHVHPDWRGRGIGTWLMRWSQDAARALGAAVTGQPLSANESAAMALLETDGYERRYEEWLFEIALDGEPAPRPLPDGYAIRSFVPGQDERAAFEVIERAFSEWPDREPRPFDDWVAVELGRPGFAPELLALVTAGNEVVAACVICFDEGEGWVDQLAVAREHRGRGLAQALLAHAFGVSWRRGARTCGLGTDERTGARRLYEHVGMRARKTYFEYVKQL